MDGATLPSGHVVAKRIATDPTQSPNIWASLSADVLTIIAHHSCACDIFALLQHTRHLWKRPVEDKQAVLRTALERPIANVGERPGAQAPV